MPNIVDRIIGDPNVVAYAANTTPRTKIDKVSVLAYLRWRWSFTLVLAGYTGNPTKLVESALNPIRQFIVTAAGKAGGANGTLKAVDAAYSYQMTRLLESTAPTVVDVSNTNGTYNGEANGKIYFMNLLSRNPNATLLDARADRLASLTVDVAFRDQTSMVTGGTGGTATLTGNVTFQVREILGMAMKPNSPWLKESQSALNVTQTKLLNEFKDLPVGNLIERILFKGTVGANDYSDPSDAVFNNTTPAEGPHLKLRVNNNYFPLDAIYQQLRNDNKERFGVETLPAGYVCWDPPGVFNVRNAAKLDAVIDTNFTGGSTNTIQATTTEIVYPKAA